MSAAGRKADPFNFDDIYKQAGVDDLFVKKTMGEQKQKAQASQPPGVASAAMGQQQGPAVQAGHGAQPSKATPAAASFDLDFLSNIATSNTGTPSTLSKPNSGVNLAGHGGHAAHSAASDPFGLFDEVPGAAPAQKHAPPPMPAAPASGGLGNLLDFDDGHGAGSTPTPAPVSAAPAPSPAPATAAAHAASPASSSSRYPDIPTYAPPAAPAPAAPTPTPVATPQPAYPSHSHATPHSAPSAAGATSPMAPSNRSQASAVSAAPSSYSQRPFGQPGSGPVPGSATSPAPPSWSSAQSPTHAGYAPHAPPPSYSGRLSDAGSADGHYSAAAPSMHGGSSASVSSTIGGYFKAFTKKAVKVAKAGIAQLEHALEGLDQNGQQQQQAGYGTAPGYPGGHSYGEGEAGVSHDEALAWAVRLADMGPHAQQQELEKMHPPLRRKVIEVLREQIRTEHRASSEARMGMAGPHSGQPGQGEYAPPQHAPYPHVPPAGPGVVHTTEYQVDGARHGGPHGEAAGRGGPHAAAAPPSYSSAVHAPPAPAPAAAAAAAAAGAAGAAAAAAAEHHDLLGMASGEVAAPPRAAAAAAAPPPPAPAPVVEDLLGFGSGHAQPPSPAAPAAGPAAPAPAPAAPAAAPPAPAVVHVDDLDDFLSGGRPSGSGAAAPGAAPAAPSPLSHRASSVASSMHPSSSAPNLGGPPGSATAVGRAAGAGGSSAALFDMLHGDDDGGAGLDVDVDVAAYKDLYKGEEGQHDEPELRKQLRAQREAAKHAKMKAALAEKLALEAEEAARREQQVQLKDQHKANVEAWRNKNKGNVRGLLGSLHTVLWPDSGWTPVSVGDMLEPGQVRKVWMRANLLVHPDKVRQRNGGAEQVALADMIFDALKDGWNVFQAAK